MVSPNLLIGVPCMFKEEEEEEELGILVVGLQTVFLWSPSKLVLVSSSLKESKMLVGVTLIGTNTIMRF